MRIEHPRADHLGFRIPADDLRSFQRLVATQWDFELARQKAAVLGPGETAEGRIVTGSLLPLTNQPGQLLELLLRFTRWFRRQFCLANRVQLPLLSLPDVDCQVARGSNLSYRYLSSKG